MAYVLNHWQNWALCAAILIASLGWVLVSVTGVIADIAYARYRIDVADNLSARRIRTQVRVLRRAAIVVVILTIGIMLLSIPQVRSIGASLLASAGLAGLVVGMAMKPTRKTPERRGICGATCAKI